jgi:hypothetical protein
MPKNKVSEYSSTASNNTDIGGINIAEGCAPSGINNAIRELMAQLKDMQSGTDGDGFTVGGAFTCSGAAVFSSTVTAPTPTTGDSSTKVATTAFVNNAVSGGLPSGCIVLWSGSVASIPSGWYLCNGSNGTPDLRNRFIVGAGSTYAVGGTGGSADAIVVSHTHTATDSGHTHNVAIPAYAGTDAGGGAIADGTSSPTSTIVNVTSNSGSASISVSTTGSSGTNANLPPYYALAYIMKA